MKRVAAKRLLAALNSGSDFDRIIQHTDGRPRQTTEVAANVLLRTTADRAAAAAEASERLRAIFNTVRN